MKLSFIVPIYNVEDYLLDCCKSILNQVDSSCEILLVDDGSTDRSSQIADDIAREHDRVTVIHKENGNVWLFLSTPLFIVIFHGICYCIV